jgi:multicomponent Na+:H+ antiporter subunit G
VTVVSAVLLLTGAMLMLIAAIGVFRFPDVLSRLHAATKAASVGIGMVLVGAGAALGIGPLAFTLLVAVFHIVTAPVAGHALGRATRPEPETGMIRPSAFPLPARVVGLAAVWVVLWGDATSANLLGGLAVGSAIATLTRRGDAQRITVRPLASLRFAATFAVLVVRSTIAVSAAALGPRSRVNPGVQRVPLPAGSTAALVATANAVSLIPGTLTLAIDTEGSTLVVHVLQTDDPAAPSIVMLHSLAGAAFPPGV